MPPQPDAASGLDRERKSLKGLAAVVVGNVPDALPSRIRPADAGNIAGGLRPMGVLVAEGLLGTFGVNSSALAQVAYPHTIILSASNRSSRFFLMPMAASTTSAVAAIIIHMPGLIWMPLEPVGLRE